MKQPFVCKSSPCSAHHQQDENGSAKSYSEYTHGHITSSTLSNDHVSCTRDGIKGCSYCYDKHSKVNTKITALAQYRSINIPTYSGCTPVNCDLVDRRESLPASFPQTTTVSATLVIQNVIFYLHTMVYMRYQPYF